jgi:CRP/FNR family transcriptional regulator, cyclic AMP receptor protein
MLEQSESTLLNVFTDPQMGGRTFSSANGEVIYDPQTPASNVYFIRRGQVRLYSVASDGSTRLVDIFGPGSWFGTAALARARAYRMKAVAVGSAVISEIGIERFLSALMRNPSYLIELNRQLAARLLSAHEEGSRLVFEDCNRRLVNALLRFSRSAASTPREGGVVLRITHDQLAQAVGVARETVSLALTQLRQRNLLQTGRNQLLFDPEVLRQSLAQASGDERIPAELPAGAREPAATLVQA